MEKTLSAIDIFTGILVDSVVEVLEASTRKKINYARTLQIIPKVSIRPEIGCFVPFHGDYSGLVVMNFTAQAAMHIYRSYMAEMGIPEDELPNEYTSTEVPDSLGELTNQVLGKAVRHMEREFELTSFFGQPKALALNYEITLVIDSAYKDNRRMVFDIEGRKFYLELAMESLELRSLGR